MTTETFITITCPKCSTPFLYPDPTLPCEPSPPGLTTQLTQLQVENARLLDIVQKDPGHAFLEAAQRAIVERHDDLKHGEREARARAEKAEQQLADAQREIGRLRRLIEEYRLVWNAAEDQLVEMRSAIHALEEKK